MRKLTKSLVTSIILLMVVSVGAIQADEQKLIDTAKSYIGTPYVYGGTSTSGFDCSGYIQHVFEQHGEHLPRTTSQMYGEGEWVSKSNLQVGDLVFFNTFGSGVSHAGIYIGDNQFAHASSSRGVTVSSLSNTYWSPRYIGAKRVADFSSQAEGQEDKVVHASLQTSSSVFDDVPEGHWSQEAVESLHDDGIINGVDDGSEFGLDRDITRNQVVALVMRSVGYNETAESSFDNVASWADAEVAAAASQGHLDYLESAFNGTQTIDRAEMAQLMVNVFDLSYSGSAEGFTDLSSNHPAYKAILTLQEHDIVEGNDFGHYEADRELSRAAFATILHRALN